MFVYREMTMKIGFIGIGNMGLPMAFNLARFGYEVTAFDKSEQACLLGQKRGLRVASTMNEFSKAENIIITMLPADDHVAEVYIGKEGILDRVSQSTILVDCSTIDVNTSRTLADEAKSRNLDMLDAPVSGGVSGAESGSLTFMVGGEGIALEKVRPVLQVMGKNIVHAGASGMGQAAKVCNNMLLGVSMIGISESFTLADRLGLDPKILFDIMSSATGDCWALRNHLPIAGIVETSAANRSFSPGFAVAMMAKDLRLAESVAKSVDLQTDLGILASTMYTEFEKGGSGHLDYSAIINLIQQKAFSK
tara:strand:+ start:594 stop:1514 length:921 start_codon:yes stop_codon:yes gene_type:complete